jgi:uncharacterized membrane protein
MAEGPLGDEFFVHGWLLVLVWVAALAWLTVSLIDYRGGNTPIARFSQKADLLVRYSLSAVLVGFGLYTIFATDPFGVDTNPKWLGAKVVAYALCIFCGVMIRRQLVPSVRRSASSSPLARHRRSRRRSSARSSAASRGSTRSGPWSCSPLPSA